MNQICSTEPSSKSTKDAATEALTLLSAEDPPPFQIYNKEGKANVLLVADHASAFIPDSLGQLGLDDSVLEQHVAWDIGSDQLVKNLADLLDAPAIMTHFSRLIIDPNRQLDDPSAFMEISDGIAIPGNLDLSEEEKTARITTFFKPYHNAIEAHIKSLDDQGIVPAFISIHTCTPVYNQIIRPWHMGVMWDTDPRLAIPMMEKLRQVEGLCLGDNEPYSGKHVHDFTIDHHPEPAGLPHVGIEVRQDLVGDDAGARKWAGILADSLKDVLADAELYQKLST